MSIIAVEKGATRATSQLTAANSDDVATNQLPTPPPGKSTSYRGSNCWLNLSFYHLVASCVITLHSIIREDNQDGIFIQLFPFPFLHHHFLFFMLQIHLLSSQSQVLLSQVLSFSLPFLPYRTFPCLKRFLPWVCLIASSLDMQNPSCDLTFIFVSLFCKDILEEIGSDNDVPDNSSGKTKAGRVTYSSSPESPEPSDREQAPRLVHSIIQEDNQDGIFIQLFPFPFLHHHFLLFMLQIHLLFSQSQVLLSQVLSFSLPFLPYRTFPCLKRFLPWVSYCIIFRYTNPIHVI